MKKYFLVNNVIMSEPYKIMPNSNSSFKVLKEGSILSIKFKFLKERSISSKSLSSFYLFIAKNGQHKKKWSVVSVSEPRSHIGLIAFLKL